MPFVLRKIAQALGIYKKLCWQAAIFSDGFKNIYDKMDDFG